MSPMQNVWNLLTGQTGRPVTRRRATNAVLTPAAFSSTLEPRTLLSAGALDLSFGKNGVVLIGNSGQPNDSVLQPDGKLVVVSGPNSNQTNVSGIVRRFNVDGSLDKTFGNNGIVNLVYTNTKFSKSVTPAVQVSVLGGGKLLVAGSDTDSIVLTRLNANGSFDTTFSNSTSPMKGVIKFSFTGFTVASVSVVANQKLLVGGTALDSQFNQRWALAQFNADGSIDKSFGLNGKVITEMSGTFPTLKAIAVQTDGRIVAAGYTDNDQTGLVPVVVRYTKLGKLDTTFGSGGMAYPAIASDGLFNSVAIASNGKIVLGGLGSPNGTDPFIGLVVRLNTNGSIDTTFGTRGVRQLPQIAGLSSVTVLPNGQVLVAGGTDVIAGQTRITRLSTGGAIDTKFGTQGFANTKFGSSNTTFTPQILLTPQNKIVIVGTGFAFTKTGSVLNLGIARFLNA